LGQNSFILPYVTNEVFTKGALFDASVSGGSNAANSLPAISGSLGEVGSKRNLWEQMRALFY